MFKKINILLLFLSLFSYSFAVQSNESKSDFEKANDLYRNNKFEDAVKEYIKLIDNGYESAALFYNLGNAYYREGNIGHAILYYEKALKLEPIDDDIIHNIALADSKTVDKIEPLPKFFIFQWWESLLAVFTIKEWTITAYIFYLLILLAIGFYFFSKQNKIQKYSFFSGLFFLGLFIFCSVLLTIRLNREESVKNAIITDTVVNIKTAPDPGSNDAFVVHEGLKVKIENKIDHWVEVRLQDGKIGWVTDNKLSVI